MNYKVILILLLFAAASFPQEESKPYFLTAEAGGGYARYFTDMVYPALSQNGFSGTVRFMWHPEHLLSIGLETGYWNLYSLDNNLSIPDGGSTDVKISMTMVPIMAVYSMKIFPVDLPQLEVKVSSGIQLLYNDAEGFGSKVSSSVLSVGYSAGASYMYPLSDVSSLGGELKYQYISKLQDADLTVQIVFSYVFLTY